MVTKHRPRSPKDLQQLGYHLRYLGCGCFRQTFLVKEVGVVIKFPMMTNLRENIWHSRYEAKTLKRINTQHKFTALRRYMPTVHLYDPRTGVLIVQNYKRCRYSDASRQFSTIIEGMVTDLFPNLRYELDLGAGNLGRNEVGQFVVLDLGIIEE